MTHTAHDDGTISFETLKQRCGGGRTKIKNVLKQNGVPFVDTGKEIFIIKEMLNKPDVVDDDPGYEG